jgi:hypothetical protein
VPRSEIDQRFFDTPYYITPNEPVGQDAFAVIREAMRSKALVALGRIVLAKRERVIALERLKAEHFLSEFLELRFEIRAILGDNRAARHRSGSRGPRGRSHHRHYSWRSGTARRRHRAPRARVGAPHPARPA